MLAGMTEEGKAVFGEPILKLPARRIPEAIVGILQRYRQDRTSAQEPFRAFVTRVGNQTVVGIDSFVAPACERRFIIRAFQSLLPALV